MNFNLFVPRRQNFLDLWSWTQTRTYSGWSDPSDDQLFSSLSLAVPQKLGQRGETSEVANDPNIFEVRLDCSHFKPEEIDVKIVDNNVIIHVKHEEKMDEHGWVSREFTRRYSLPKECEVYSAKTSLSPNGMLTIEVPKKRLEPLKDNERVVPIDAIHDLNANEIQN